MLVTEADRRLRSEAIPEAFRGLPITLVYIGVLALAIYVLQTSLFGAWSFRGYHFDLLPVRQPFD